MRQEQERFRSVDRGSAPDGIPLGVDTNPPLRWKSIAEDRDSEERRLQEIRFSLRLEDNREKREKGSHKANLPKSDGFVPFDEEPQEEYLFVNNYGGAWSQKMELNRRGVERTLKIAHLDGKVFLTTLAPSRSRSEAQGNELAAKRFLIFDNKTQKAEEENPYKRVTSVQEGWRIEVNDQRLREELGEKYSGQELQKAFINRFNNQLRIALIECVWREKCSSEKDEHFRGKLVGSMLFPTMQSLFNIPVFLTGPSLLNALDYWLVFVGYGIVNFLAAPDRRNFRAFEKRAKEINPNFKLPAHQYRKIDGKWEYFMPQVEVDKVARTYAYLVGKGRRLVREVGEEK